MLANVSAMKIESSGTARNGKNGHEWVDELLNNSLSPDPQATFPRGDEGYEEDDDDSEHLVLGNEDELTDADFEQVGEFEIDDDGTEDFDPDDDEEDDDDDEM